MYFKKWDKVFDLSSFKLTRTSEDLFKDAYQMMDVVQLNERIDSFGRYEKNLAKNLGIYLSPNIEAMGNDSQMTALTKRVVATKKTVTYKSSFIDYKPDSLKGRVVASSINTVRNSKGMIDISSNDKTLHHENFLQFNVEWHRKFTLSFACVLLFLIGAPLGAIIRKGGLGMPMVIAVAFFVVFHIMSITGEKLAKTGSMPAWLGMWMATGMLLPIAFILINQARNDSQIFSKEWYMRVWSKAISAFKKSK